MNYKIFKYRNIFPADITEPEQMLLKLMWIWDFPLHQRSVRIILKPFVCDELVPKLLERMVNGKYLVKKDTGLGAFYGLAAKSKRYLDYNKEHSPHRTTDIPDRTLCTNLMKGELCAEAIIRVAVTVYMEAWASWTSLQRSVYIQEKNFDPAGFQAALKASNTAAIDVLPRSILDQDKLTAAIAKAFQAGEMPFTDDQKNLIYDWKRKPFLETINRYDITNHSKMRFSAQRKALGLINTEEKAKRHQELTAQLNIAQQFMKGITPYCIIYPYNGSNSQGKVISPQILEYNGIVLTLSNAQLSFHVFNDCVNGLRRDTLLSRIDIALSLAETLNCEHRITVHTLEENKTVMQKHITWILRNKKLPDDPEIDIKTVSTKNPATKYDTISSIKGGSL